MVTCFSICRPSLKKSKPPARWHLSLICTNLQYSTVAYNKCNKWAVYGIQISCHFNLHKNEVYGDVDESLHLLYITFRITCDKMAQIKISNWLLAILEKHKHWSILNGHKSAINKFWYCILSTMRNFVTEPCPALHVSWTIRIK